MSLQFLTYRVQGASTENQSLRLGPRAFGTVKRTVAVDKMERIPTHNESETVFF